MAKLQKSFADYFRIPILLRPVGRTPLSLASDLAMSFNSSNPVLLIDERYQREKTNSHFPLLSTRGIGTTQKFYFRDRDFQNDWSQFQIIYHCRVVIGILCIQSNIGTNFEQVLEKFRKTIRDESRKLMGVILVNGVPQNIVKGEDMVVIPQKLSDSEVWSFLEPWMYHVLLMVQTQLCEDIIDYKNQSNQVIVFNKNEERPESKTVKKKKRARCTKLCADTHLMLKLYPEAYQIYAEAQDVLRKIDDYVWLLGCLQGKMACLTSGQQLPGISDHTEVFHEHVSESISIAKKTKISSFQTENHFKRFKIFTDQPLYLDQVITNYINENIRLHVEDQKFNIWLQLGAIYKEAGLHRKKNYCYYQAALLYLQKKPQFSLLLLKQIKEGKGIKDWPQLYTKLIKLIIQTHLQTFNGQLQLQLLENCSFHLNRKDLKIAIETLNFSHFQEVRINRSNCMVQIIDFTCSQSQIKPKTNRLLQKQDPQPKGFFMSWKKKQQRFLYQYNELIVFNGQFNNSMAFPIRLTLLIPAYKEMKEIQIYLPAGQLTKICEKISFNPNQENCTEENIDIETVYIKIWNFIFTEKLAKPLRIQMYEQTPQFSHRVCEQLRIQSSSPIMFPIELIRLKQTVPCQILRIDISVYYTVDVGFQQNRFFLKNQSQKLMVIENGSNYSGKQQVLQLKPLKSDRKNVKKIEICLQYIRSQKSKYQLSNYSVIKCYIINSIVCMFVSGQSFTIKNALDYGKGCFKPAAQGKIVQESAVVKLEVSKQDYDLIPYQLKITSPYQEVECVLGANARASVQIKVPKIEPGKQLFLRVTWKGITNIHKQGEFQFEVPSLTFLEKADKIIDFRSVQEGQNEASKNLKQLKIQYSVMGENLSHRVVVIPLITKQNRQYVLKGQHRIKTSQKECKNDITVIAKANYQQRYMFALQFDDGWIYYNPKVIHTNSFYQHKGL